MTARPPHSCTAWSDEDDEVESARVRLSLSPAVAGLGMVVDRWWEQFAVGWPEAEAGPYRLARRTIERWVRGGELDDLLGRLCPPGTYTVLREGERVWMSDTPAEVADHFPFLRRAHGHVLITGLGLGMATKAVLAKACVRSLTVVERDADIIALVGPLVSAGARGRLRIVHGDAFDPPAELLERRYDAAWHDVWATVVDHNLVQMDALEALYPARWAASWSRPLAQLMADAAAWAAEQDEQ